MGAVAQGSPAHSFIAQLGEGRGTTGWEVLYWPLPMAMEFQPFKCYHSDKDEFLAPAQ